MTFAQTLSLSMREFRRTGRGEGTITIDGDVVAVALPRWGNVNARLAVPAMGDIWWRITRHDELAPPGGFRIGAHHVMTTDEQLARAWIDEPVLEALATDTNTATYALRSDHVALEVPDCPGPFYLRDPLRIAALLATRPHRLARELTAATAFLAPVAHGERWGLNSTFTIVIARHGVDVVIDWIRAAAQVRTRARIVIGDRKRSRDDLLASRDKQVAALGDATTTRDDRHLIVLRDGVIPTREHLDSTLDLLFAIGLSQRGSTSLGAYR